MASKEHCRRPHVLSSIGCSLQHRSVVSCVPEPARARLRQPVPSGMAAGCGGVGL
ncbi:MULTISPECIES: hypothetical protein [unclassified Microcoleus]|uniref:hypothetical protein n=1 Tax=unclassified Microcoleus TaxID=2642155 RepID=UPI002FD3C169